MLLHLVMPVRQSLQSLGRSWSSYRLSEKYILRRRQLACTCILRVSRQRLRQALRVNSARLSCTMFQPGTRAKPMVVRKVDTFVSVWYVLNRKRRFIPSSSSTFQTIHMILGTPIFKITLCSIIAKLWSLLKNQIFHRKPT